MNYKALLLALALIGLPGHAFAVGVWEYNDDVTGLPLTIDPATTPAPAGYFTQSEVDAAGGSAYSVTEADVITAMTEISPFLFFAFIAGWVAAFAPAHLLRFLQGLLTGRRV